MRCNMAGRKGHLVKNAVRSILILSAASLLFACGNGTSEVNPSVQAGLSANVAAQGQLAASVIPAGPCSDVATISAGVYETAGLKGDGTVSAVGYNGYGQTDVSSWKNMKAIAAAWYHTVGLKDDGTVVAVGYTGFGQMDVSSWKNIKAVAAAWYHTVGLREDGTAVAVGTNSYGQLDVSSWTKMKAIAAGVYHTVGLKEDGTAAAVGSNTDGQLNVSSWTDIKAIAAGWYQTIGLKKDGTVVAAGRNNYGQLNVSAWTNIKAIAGGAYHTVGLKDDGTVVAVGVNNYGQTNVSSWRNIKAIAAGAYHTVGLKDDGTVVAAGNNNYSQLNVSSWTNIMPLCESVCVDGLSPVTMATVTGTLGNNGWYVSDVQMTLTASDNDGGMGVMGIYYSVDDTEAIAMGSSASHTIAGDGTHTVTWFAVDNAGNAEKSQAMTINIDKTPPSIPVLLTDRAILWPPNHTMMDVLIGGYAVDSGSGVASTTLTVSDEYGIYNMSGVEFGIAIQLESWRAGTDMDGRKYTITAVTADRAGNQSSASTTVIVPHDMR